MLPFQTAVFVSANNWFPAQDIEGISSLFFEFMKLWNDFEWNEPIRILISFYVESNCSKLVESNIQLIQSAFELLAWLLLTQNNQIISEDGLEKLNAADLLRILFSWLKIPTGIPPIQETTFLDELIKVSKRENFTDSPECITRIRNRITHPKRKNKKDKENKIPLLKYSALARRETSNLCLWYLEMCLLKRMDYQGVYSNRLRFKYLGDYDPVPW